MKATKQAEAEIAEEFEAAIEPDPKLYESSIASTPPLLPPQPGNSEEFGQNLRWATYH